jgi:hypothetical protein
MVGIRLRAIMGCGTISHRFGQGAEAPMKWFRKVFGRADYSADQQKLATLHLVAGDPQGMMMLVGRNKLFQDVVYIRMPETMASSFPDYEIAGPPEEAEVSGLYGHQEDLNGYIRQKH